MDNRSLPPSRHESSGSGSLQDLSVEVKDMEIDLKELEVLVSNNNDSVTKMLDPHNIPYLYQQASTSVVHILCAPLTDDRSLVEDDKIIGTGFIVDSSNGCLIITSSNLIMSNEWNLDWLNSTHLIAVKFSANNSSRATIVYFDAPHGITMLKVQKFSGLPCLKFFEENESSKDELRGMPIFSISRIECSGILHFSTLSLGRISQRCIPVPRTLDRKCHCYMHNLQNPNMGSVGAPILNFAGEVVAMHSSKENLCSFAIGLKSLKGAFIRYFKLSKTYNSFSVNDVLDVGLKCI